MGIIWCGGEDIDFPIGVKPLTNTSDYRSEYARCSLYGGNFATSNSFATITSGWFSFHARTSSGTTSSFDCLMAGITIGGSADGFWIRKSSGKVELRNIVSGVNSIIATEEGTSLVTAGINKFDMQFVYGESGSIKVYLDTVLVIDYSGDTRISAASGFSSVSVHGHSASSSGSLSELIVADEDTRLMSLVTLAPNGAGDVNDFTGAYTDVDETSIDRADTIHTATAGDVFTCALSDLPSGSFAVKAVNVVADAVDASAGLDLKLGVRSGATTSTGTAIPLSGAWETKSRLMNTNPVTSAAWTPTEVDALQLAIETVTA